MALCWFRHWLGQRLIANRGYNGPDGGYSLYGAIAAAGEAYMDKAILSQFHTMFPLTKKALNVLENHLLEIKECMAEWVEKSNLLKSNCQLNVQQFPVPYITYVEFENADFPWATPKEMEDPKPLKRGRRPGGNDIVQQNLEAAKKHQEQKEKGVDSSDLSEGEPDEEEDEGAVRGAKRTCID